MPQGTRPSVSSLPSTYMTSTIDPTWLRMSGRVTHPELGGGVRICGRQLVAQVATTAGDSQLFSVASSPSDVTINAIKLTPDALGGRLALQARTYDRYCFRKAVLTYISRVPTTQAGGFALGYVGDVSAPAFTYAAVSSMSPSINSPFISPITRLSMVDDMTTTKTWYTLIDTTSVASQRLTVQGIVCGVPDATSIGATVMGWLWLDYMIDLYQPTQDEGFSFHLSEDERNALQKYRESKSISSKEDSSGNQTKNLTDSLSEIGSLQLRIQQLKSGNLNL